MDKTINRSKYQKKLLNHYLKKGFEDDEDLLFYIKEFLGFEYPIETFCSHHQSPAKILTDIYFEKTLYTLIWANRTGGKTRLVSILNHLDALFKGPIEIVNAGAALDQAAKGYQYFLESFKHPLLKQYLPDPIQSRSTLTNGSEVKIITGSFKGFNGPHPAKVRIDEVELMEWPVLEEGLNMSKSNGKVLAQDVLSSTRKFSHGTVQRLIDEQKERQLKISSYCVWDIVEQCDRKCQDDKKYGNCPIYHLCGGKAHGGKGWYPISDLIKKGLNLTKNTFEAQWENKRPSDAPLVYDTFDREKHVKTWDQLYEIFKVEEFKKKRIPSEWTHVGGIDFGTNFAFLSLAIEPTTRTWILFNEYFCDVDRRLKEHAYHIENSPGFNNFGPIYGDAAAKQDRIELRGYGIKIKASLKGKESILLGVDEIKLQLQNNPILDRPKFFVVDGRAPHTIQEFEIWSWELQDDGKPNTEKPNDGDDHCLDALRYAIFSYGRIGGSYRAITVEGV